MKTRVCFRLFALALVAVLAGCELDDSSSDEPVSSCLNEFQGPNSTEETVSTFTISDQNDNPFGATLDQTLFRQFTQFAEPANGSIDDADTFYSFLGSQLEESLALRPLPSYTELRSRTDLIEAMATSGLEPFKEARETLASCVREEADAGGRIITGARISEESEEENPERWEYALLYSYNPDVLEDVTPIGPNIQRLVLSGTTTLVSFYPLDTFRGRSAVSGFKQPIKLSLGIGAQPEDVIPVDDTENPPENEDSEAGNNTDESLLFESILPESDESAGGTDQWSWSATNTDGTSIFDTENKIRCVRAIADYSQGEVTVRMSETTCPSINSPSEQANWTPVKEFSYQSAAPSTAQTRN